MFVVHGGALRRGSVSIFISLISGGGSEELVVDGASAYSKYSRALNSTAPRASASCRAAAAQGLTPLPRAA